MVEQRGWGMGWISGRRMWRVAVAPIVAGALLFGFVAFGHGDAKPARSAHVSAQDLLLAAVQARKGISLEYDGITGPPSANHAAHAALRSFSFGVTRAIGSVTGSAGREAGAPVLTDIKVTKLSDKYSALFLKQALV